MTEANPKLHRNIYERNTFKGATRNPLIQNPDAIDEAFAEAVNRAMYTAMELARVLVGTHQAAIAVIVQNDWNTARKFFSLSEKYAAWKNYDTPATGFGIHNWLLKSDAPVRFTQAELEAHPEWFGFGTEAGKHPPMNGWLAAPIIDKNGTNWGLFQLSDKYEGEFTAEDEKHFLKLVELTSDTLEALWEVRNLRKAQANT